jgi:MoxR-like ATPase
MQQPNAPTPNQSPGQVAEGTPGPASGHQDKLRRLEQNMGEAILGKPEIIRLCLIGLLAGEHVLLEDVPGVGKTLVGKTLAKSIDGNFSRLQFTPDLLPSDLLGSSVYETKESEFRFHKGPIFANVVLADEINRAPPRTQSAMLEAMSDGQVSADGATYDLPSPFIVIATQNPFEFEGTYPLPESQLDRFLLRSSIGYPNREHERRVLRTHRTGEPVDQLQPAVSIDDIVAIQSAVRDVHVEPAIDDYLLDIVDATRNCEEFHVGASTRGALCLYRAAQAAAFLEGRSFVIPDDIKSLAVAVLSHRVVLAGTLQADGRQTAENTIQLIVDRAPVPQ